LGASKPEQLTDSLKGLEMTLDEEEMKICNSIWYRIPRNEDPGIALR
jgi:aryl-alcohol dehydrogenase-like predicted oxidoreductase